MEATGFHPNLTIGGNAPSEYLVTGQNRWNIEQERMDEILGFYLIEPLILRSDDIEGFMFSRIERLSAISEAAMGKPVAIESIDLLKNEGLMKDVYADEDSLMGTDG
jgi:hypothetical protein